MTGATMFRTIEACKPTLLLDEMDRSPKEKKEMITVVLNAGFHRDGRVDRCDGNEHKVRSFDVYCPKALAGIGDYMTDTVMDRSIKLSMQKKLKSQKVEKFRRYRPEKLQRKCIRWAKDNAEALIQPQIQMPSVLSDRQEDIWECLFAIAEIAGKEWSKRVYNAAAQQAAGTATDVTDDLIFLGSIRSFIRENNTPCFSSKRMCKWLNLQEDLPFKDWRLGKGIDQRLLARGLRPFGIFPHSINEGGKKRPKGYSRTDLQEAFGRYLPSEPLPATNPENSASTANLQPLLIGLVADQNGENLLEF